MAATMASSGRSGLNDPLTIERIAYAAAGMVTADHSGIFRRGITN